jgi:hypothetical protein
MTLKQTSDPMTDEAQRIAKGLTEAQREGLMRKPCPSWWGSVPACMPFRKGTADALANRGLCLRFNPTMRFWGNARTLTPLGLAVREILIRESQS